jgi:hypothetical protein
VAKLEVGLAGERTKKALGSRGRAVARIMKTNRAAEEAYAVSSEPRTAPIDVIGRCSRYSRTSLPMINLASMSAGVTGKGRETALVVSRQIDV